jgi:hypothetical protein
MKEMFRMGLAHSINEDGALEQFAPIELPSDEGIVNKALEIQWSNTLFQDGAKWMRDKIQGGNNEQQ